MPQDKEFRNVYKQIRLLKEREVKFTNLQDTKNQLMHKSYFNLINGFETLLLNDPKNPPKKYTNTNFQDFIDLYEFDLHLSSIILSKISEFETKLKTSIAYFFSKNNCSTLVENNNYIDINCYKIPGNTDGPAEYVSNFKNHRLFKNYFFEGHFRGTFNGKVKFKNDRTVLEGHFVGRFGSTPIREIVNGTLTFKNHRQNALLQQIRSITTSSGTPISITINIRNERIYGLNYIDDCKRKFNYINEYNNPPFWVTIKPLMMNDLLVLMYGLDNRTFNEILKNFNLKPNDKEKFLNSIAILKELRNTCAHFELVNRFRTSSRTPINARLIAELNLTPLRSQYIIKLYDTLKILRLYVDLSNIRKYVWDFYNTLSRTGRLNLATKLFDRMGNSNIYEWI